MSNEIQINKNLSNEETYKQLLSTMEYIINNEVPLVSNLSNFTALLKQSFEKISWVGFYFLENENLWLGPFQGKLACTKIKSGLGVCGTAASNQKTIIVDNVDEFPGHIACDSDSKSEIVIPIFYNDKIWGVLDLDSHQYSAFNETDKLFLEKMLTFISEKLDLSDKMI